MAEFVNSIGQVRGKFGNVVAYVRANGKNYCKGASISRKPSTESQKQQAAAFAVVVSRKGWMARAIRLGFPGNQYPKGFNGFTSANVTTAVMVEKVNPMKPIVRYKKAIQEYRGIIVIRNFAWRRVRLSVRLLVVRWRPRAGRCISRIKEWPWRL